MAFDKRKEQAQLTKTYTVTQYSKIQANIIPCIISYSYKLTISFKPSM